jgi:hemoglobin-like flavoprotein
MKEEQIILIKKTWKIFQRINPVLVGDVFYSKLFLESPRLKNMFSISKEEQSKKLIEMLNMIVGRLDRLNELTEDIKQLAIRHAGYGVKPAHYDAAGSALLWTLEKGLGNDWTADVREAWVCCYTTLANAMMNAFSAAPPERQPEKTTE